MTLDGAPRPSVEGYSLGPVLGRGGMGVVYRARQLSLDREVALKLILASLDEELRGQAGNASTDILFTVTQLNLLHRIATQWYDAMLRNEAALDSNRAGSRLASLDFLTQQVEPRWESLGDLGLWTRWVAFHVAADALTHCRQDPARRSASIRVINRTWHQLDFDDPLPMDSTLLPYTLQGIKRELDVDPSLPVDPGLLRTWGKLAGLTDPGD